MGAQQSTANIKVVPQQLCEKQRDAEEAAGHLEQRFKRLDLGNSVKASDSVTAEHVEAWSKSYASQPARQAIGTILSYDVRRAGSLSRLMMQPQTANRTCWLT